MSKPKQKTYKFMANVPATYGLSDGSTISMSPGGVYQLGKDELPALKGRKLLIEIEPEVEDETENSPAPVTVPETRMGKTRKSKPTPSAIASSEEPTKPDLKPE